MANIEQKLVAASADNPIVAGDRVVIATPWLKACGYLSLDGVFMEVVEVKDFGFRGRSYTVKMPNGKEWPVMSWRGVFKAAPIIQ